MRPVLFDFDGTLADSAPVIKQSYIETMRKEQGKDYPPDFFTPFIGPPLEDTFATLGADDVARYVTTYRSFYAQRMFDTKLFPGIKEMLAKLSAAGTPLAVATSKRQDYAEKLVDFLGISEYLQVVAGSLEGGKRGQKRHRVEDALAELRAKGHSSAGAVMVGDRIHDIEGASANGLHTILVAWGEGPVHERKQAWKVAYSVPELTDMLFEPVHPESSAGAPSRL